MFRLIYFAIAALFSFLRNEFRNLFHAFKELSPAHGFKQIFRHPDADGILGVREIIISAEYDNLGCRKVFPHKT